MTLQLTTFANQIALYVNSGKILADELSVACRRSMKIGVYSPTVLPDIPGMPDEIPRLQIQSERGFQLSMSPVRIDLTLDVSVGYEKADEDLFFENVRLLLDLLNDYGFDYSRVGLVRRFYQVMNKPGDLVAENFGGRSRDGLSDFNVTAVYDSIVSRLHCKNVFNVGSGMIRGIEPGLVAMRDLNINPGQEIMTRVRVEEFVNSASALLNGESMAAFIGGDNGAEE